MTELETILHNAEDEPDRLRLVATRTDAPRDTTADAQQRSYENYLRIKRGVGDEALKAAGLPPAEELSYEAYVAALGTKSPAKPPQDAALRQKPEPRIPELRAWHGSETLRAKPSLRLQGSDVVPDEAGAPRQSTEITPPRLRRNLTAIASSILSLLAVFLIGLFLMQFDLGALWRGANPAPAGEVAQDTLQPAPAATASVPLALTDADDLPLLPLPPEVTDVAALPVFPSPGDVLAPDKVTKPKKKSAKAAKKVEDGNAGTEWTPPASKVVKSKNALPATTPATAPEPAKLPKSTPTSNFWQPLMEFFAVSQVPAAIAGAPQTSNAARTVKLREDK